MFKRFFVLVILSLSLQNYAMHSYYSETCSNDHLSLEYKGNSPVGGYYQFDNIQNPTQLDVYDFFAVWYNDTHDAPYSPEDYTSASVVYKDLELTNIVNQPITNDGCFDTKISDFTKTIKIDKVSTQAQRLLGINECQKIEMTCHSQLDTPNPIDCF